jgi:hypothetical protein
MKCIVQDGEKYGRSLAVAVLVNELKGILAKSKR